VGVADVRCAHQPPGDIVVLTQLLVEDQAHAGPERSGRVLQQHDAGGRLLDDLKHAEDEAGPRVVVAGALSGDAVALRAGAPRWWMRRAGGRAPR